MKLFGQDRREAYIRSNPTSVHGKARAAQTRTPRQEPRVAQCWGWSDILMYGMGMNYGVSRPISQVQ